MSRVLLSVFGLVSSAALTAAEPEYLPLQTGNVWIYRGSGTGSQTATVEVTRAESVAGNTWYYTEGWPDGAPAWLRTAADGTVWKLDPQSNRESVWAAFARNEGETYDTVIDPCNATAVLRSKSAKHTGPVGEIAAAAVVAYPPGPCADAGITREVYAPWIGLVQREVTTIAGPRTYNLIYARLGGVTVVSGPELAFSVSLDAAKYQPGARASARIALRHTQPEPLRVVFRSGQTFDLVVRDETGTVVWRWSMDKIFTQQIRTVDFPYGEKNWMVDFAVPTRPGKYTAEALLTTLAPAVYQAVVAFEAVAP
jgi:hypothetical protein